MIVINLGFVLIVVGGIGLIATYLMWRKL